MKMIRAVSIIPRTLLPNIIEFVSDYSISISFSLSRALLKSSSTNNTSLLWKFCISSRFQEYFVDRLHFSNWLRQIEKMFGMMLLSRLLFSSINDVFMKNQVLKLGMKVIISRRCFVIQVSRARGMGVLWFQISILYHLILYTSSFCLRPVT